MKNLIYTNYLCTAELDTNLLLEVVYTLGLRALSVIFCKGFIHRLLQVSAYLNREEKEKKTQCMHSGALLMGSQYII